MRQSCNKCVLHSQEVLEIGNTGNATLTFQLTRSGTGLGVEWAKFSPILDPGLNNVTVGTSFAVPLSAVALQAYNVGDVLSADLVLTTNDPLFPPMTVWPDSSSLFQ